MTSYLRMVEAKLPPGFRFHPRDDELICDYLIPIKLNSPLSSTAAADGGEGGGSFPMLIDIDLNHCEPWDLPDTACVGNKEWYFFNLRDRKYATGQRTNRATMTGYWKATCKDRQVVRKRTLVGMRKTLVFYQGRAPKGKKTDWVMHEFRSESHCGDPPPRYSGKEDWVLCKVFYKSISGTGMTTTKMPATRTMRTETSYDDTCSSSLLPPPLSSDPAFVAFDQAHFTLPPPPSINIPSTTTTSALEQVPCFSNINYPQNINPYNTIMINPISMDLMANNLPKDLASCYLKLQKVNNYKRDHHEAGSESYLTEAALSSSIWYPFQNN